MIELCLILPPHCCNENARQEIKNLTDDITEYTNEEDGAAHYLKLIY